MRATEEPALGQPKPSPPWTDDELEFLEVGMDQANALSLSPTEAIGVWIDIGSMLARPPLGCLQTAIKMQTNPSAVEQRKWPFPRCHAAPRLLTNALLLQSRDKPESWRPF